MNRILIRVSTVLFLAACTLAVPAFADEPESLDADARQAAAGDPPTIPHKISDDMMDEKCNVCHRDGKNGAPQTSHPERLTCTQCHVPGEIKAKKPAKKGKTKK